MSSKLELERKLMNMSSEEFLALLDNKGIAISDMERQRLASGNKAARRGAINRYHLTFSEWDMWNLKYRSVVTDIEVYRHMLAECAKSTDRTIAEVFSGDFCTPEERAEAEKESDRLRKEIAELRKQRDYLLSIEP